MLSDELIEKVVERLANRMEQANIYVLKEIARSIKEIGTINPTKLQQLIQTLKYGGNYKKIIKKLEQLTKLNASEIEAIFEEVAKSDYKLAKKFYDYRNMEYVPYGKNKELQTQVKALASIAKDEYMNLTKTTALGFGYKQPDGSIKFTQLKQAYRDIVDEAFLSVSQGKETFDSAMYRQLRNLGESGLKVQYETGYTRRLDSALRMNLKSALRNLHNEVQKQVGEEFGADGVEISVHENPAEDHEDAQGRLFSNEEFEKLQTEGTATTYDKKHIDMHKGANFRPISEWNCYHYTFAIVLGVSEPNYSDKQLKEIKERNDKGFEYEGKHYSMYEGTQLQRQIETEIRRQKDNQIIANEADNQQLLLDSKKRIRALRQKYKELCDISGLAPKLERMKI